MKTTKSIIKIFSIALISTSLFSCSPEEDLKSEKLNYREITNNSYDKYGNAFIEILEEFYSKYEDSVFTDLQKIDRIKQIVDSNPTIIGLNENYSTISITTLQNLLDTNTTLDQVLERTSLSIEAKISYKNFNNSLQNLPLSDILDHINDYEYTVYNSNTLTQNDKNAILITTNMIKESHSNGGGKKGGKKNNGGNSGNNGSNSGNNGGNNGNNNDDLPDYDWGRNGQRITYAAFSGVEINNSSSVLFAATLSVF